MDWQTIRKLYPHRWLVVEAINAYTDEKRGKRVIDHLEVIETFADDWKEAWECYKRLHHADKWREYYFLHTNREELDIGVMDEFGRMLDEL
jgi:hypothetical protein